MPFEALETIMKENAPPMASLSYLRNARKGKDFDRARVKPKLIVTLPTAICISKKTKFTIFVGTGTDRGKVRVCGVAQSAVGGVKATDFKNHVVLRFGHVPRFGDEIFDGMKCPIVRIDDDTYELTVPIDLLAAEPKTTPRKIG